MITLFMTIYIFGIVKRACIKVCMILIRPFYVFGKGHNNPTLLRGEAPSSRRININHAPGQFYTNYEDIMVSSIKGI